MNLKNSRMIPQAPNSRQGIVDSRLSDIYQLLPPVALVEKFPATDFTDNLVKGTRKVFHDILCDSDDRLVVIAGPCSIHDPETALEYARRFKALAAEVSEKGRVLSVWNAVHLVWVVPVIEKQDAFQPVVPCDAYLHCVSVRFHPSRLREDAVHNPVSIFFSVEIPYVQNGIRDVAFFTVAEQGRSEVPPFRRVRDFLTEPGESQHCRHYVGGAEHG